MNILNNKQNEKIMYQLYADRMNLGEELTFDERFDRDRAIIKVLFEQWDMEPEEHDKLAGAIALKYRKVFETYMGVKNLIEQIQKNELNLSDFTHADNLKDLFILQNALNELIADIRNQHKNYIVVHRNGGAK
ncbi:hypothetical protein [Staphylococcus hominis]|uniref:hypothetical protein n=1 Tax=Staphylococcus hominis TaxID=1290 RepID=UPI0011A9AB4D|nr:hypothetical protein [Staphylococcus hominis]